jgi:two-component system CheB/CheR fusion protein
MSIDELDSAESLLPPDKPDIGAHPAPCPVVGLGASAGGLEAFQNFLSVLPDDPGHAYVLVQHLDPNHESMLAELLSRRTVLPVTQIHDGMAIEPNRVYLIPPNASLMIEKARLRLSHFAEPRGFRRPIDVFFRSLAADQGPNAACIVLSGTGGDGSEGLRAVKEAGGLTLAQEPETAKYDGMPKSAVATGLVDRVLAVRDMPKAIRDYFEHTPAASGGANEEDTAFLLKVCDELRRRLGHDFSQYKRSTMLRRVHRRMQVIGAASQAAYLARLHEQPSEAELLFRDLLINVTNFFRDAEAFDYLRREVIPELFRNKGAGDTVRIWAPGCSSGEEAYSIAILITEHLARAEVKPRVQIFATDIDEPMLQKARNARYPQSAVKDVPLELLDRYFYAHDDDYVLAQQIRDMVRVSNHNLIKDPPFSRVDMVICRNLLIYLNPSLQQRLIPVFHYALKMGGWLFLGSAENIGGRADLFDTIEPNARVFRRKGGPRQSVAMPLISQSLAHTFPENGPADRHLAPAERNDIVMRRVIEHYAPAHVVVNAHNEIVRASRRTGRYLELAEGTVSTDITDFAKRGLRSAVRSLLESVRLTGKRTIKRDVRVEHDGGDFAVDVTADPLNEDEILLVFQDAAAVETDATEVVVDAYSDEDCIKQLEDELDETRVKLRTTVEELETSNEELKSSNEEMMSMNEELQSTNEELATVNEELKNKVDQLARTNADLQNFIESTQVPTIFLDKKLRIRSFTPATKTLFRFQEQDKGRPLSDLVSRAGGQCETLASKVLETGEAVEQELVLADSGEAYVLRVLPYRGPDNTVDGVILVFADVTKIRQHEGLVRQRSHEIETLYRTAPVGMALIDRNRRYLKVNRQLAELSGAPMEEHIGRMFKDVAPMPFDKLERPMAEVFERGLEVVNLEVTVPGTSGTTRDFLVDIYPYEEDGRVTAVGIIVKDVSELRRLEKELRRLMDELQHRVKNTLATVASIIGQTVSNSRADRIELGDTLKRRINALAATHDLLTSRDWRGASLRQILEAELMPYGHSDRIVLEGPTVELPPRHALALTMTVHELTTNAAKYGALSNPDGKLSIDWALNVDSSGRRVTINWSEVGIQPLPATGVVESFGTRLIKNAIAHDLRGRCEHTLSPQGLACKITVPF